MDVEAFYNSPEWRSLADAAVARDADRCLVARLLGGSCSARLHAHHIRSVVERPDLALDLDNVGTACDRHHPKWEALRRALNRLGKHPRCPHRHAYPEGRRLCEARRARLAA